MKLHFGLHQYLRNVLVLDPSELSTLLRRVSEDTNDIIDLAVNTAGVEQEKLSTKDVLARLVAAVEERSSAASSEDVFEHESNKKLCEAAKLGGLKCDVRQPSRTRLKHSGTMQRPDGKGPRPGSEKWMNPDNDEVEAVSPVDHTPLSDQ